MKFLNKWLNPKFQDIIAVCSQIKTYECLQPRILSLKKIRKFYLCGKMTAITKPYRSPVAASGCAIKMTLLTIDKTNHFPSNPYSD